jgi:hypothetical protein
MMGYCPVDAELKSLLNSWRWVVVPADRLATDGDTKPHEDRSKELPTEMVVSMVNTFMIAPAEFTVSFFLSK